MNRFCRSLLVSAAAVTAVGCVSQEQYRRALSDIDNMREQRDALARYVDEMSAENQRLSDQVQTLGASAADADWIRQQKARLAELLAEFEGADGAIPGVTVRRGAEGIVVDVQGEVLFPSGKAEISAAGQQTLRQLVPTLMRRGNQLRVEGHTDNDPIRNSPWRTNLRLSTERALAVAEFLQREGLPAERIGIGGYGEHRPQLPGASSEAKQANRRVEILLIDAK